MRQRKQEHDGGAEQDRHHGNGDLRPGGGGEAAQQPEHDRRQGRVGVGEVLDQPDERSEERAEHDPTEHHHEHRGGTTHGQGEEEAERDETEDEGASDEEDRPEAEQQRHRSTERRPCRDADDVRTHQWVAERGLEGGTGDGQPASDQDREQHPREPDELDDGSLGLADAAIGKQPGPQDLHDM